MQTRELRFKHIGYFLLYMVRHNFRKNFKLIPLKKKGWFAGVVLFIMYRLKGDDLEQLEKEAEDRIRINKAIKEMQKSSP